MKRGSTRTTVLFTLALKYGWVCWYCNLPLRPSPNRPLAESCHHAQWIVKDPVVHIDHIIPVCAGGTDDIENLALACEFCNRAKLNLDAATFLEWLDRIRSVDAWTPIRDGRKKF